jgi:hypothetical protein
MKLALCTLAICLSLLASVLTLKEAVRAEGKRVRAAIPKALVEPLEADKGSESAAQKLDAIQSQLGSLGRRLALLEEASGRPARAAAPAQPQDNKAADPLLSEVRALDASVRDLSVSVSRLAGVPDHLARLTTYIDQSFDHLDKRLTEKTTPDELLVSVDWLVKKVDDIDHYFTPLYAFLGVVYDPANESVIRGYPSIDARLNAFAEDLDALQKAVADIRRNMTVQTVIEPSKYQR